VSITINVVSSNPNQTRCTRYNIKVCQWLAAGRWFSPDTPAFSTNKTDRHDITTIFVKVALMLELFHQCMHIFPIIVIL